MCVTVTESDTVRVCEGVHERVWELCEIISCLCACGWVFVQHHPTHGHTHTPVHTSNTKRKREKALRECERVRECEVD